MARICIDCEHKVKRHVCFGGSAFFVDACKLKRARMIESKLLDWAVTYHKSYKWIATPDRCNDFAKKAK